VDSFGQYVYLDMGCFEGKPMSADNSNLLRSIAKTFTLEPKHQAVINNCADLIERQQRQIAAYQVIIRMMYFDIGIPEKAENVITEIEKL
jgi:hypothetical protein